MSETSLPIPEEFLEAVARRAAELVQVEQVPRSPWLNTEQAAEYIAASTGRIHDLVSLRKITPRRDGRRLLFRREDLDHYLEQ
jgi:excisionase family DNA binding protein